MGGIPVISCGVARRLTGTMSSSLLLASLCCSPASCSPSEGSYSHKSAVSDGGCLSALFAAFLADFGCCASGCSLTGLWKNSFHPAEERGPLCFLLPSGCHLTGGSTSSGSLPVARDLLSVSHSFLLTWELLAPPRRPVQRAVLAEGGEHRSVSPSEGTEGRWGEGGACSP